MRFINCVTYKFCVILVILRNRNCSCRPYRISIIDMK